ncbi:MAG: EF-P lysine aminoacylase EpmA [Kofleriaceae bacterium]
MSGDDEVRGRVLEVRHGAALIRAARADVWLAADPSWRAGDLVRVVDGVGQVVRSFAGGDYPAPGTEVARLGRGRLTTLEARARALATLRRYFHEQAFLEVETPLWVRSPGLEIALDPVPADGGWLITSPEFQMKRLLAAGLDRIFQVCRCFRNEEDGAQHQREFSMVEWYRAWEDLDAIAADVEQLVAAVCPVLEGRPVARWGGRAVDVTPPWPRMTVAEAFQRFAGFEVVGDEPAAELARRARAAGVDLGDAEQWDDVFYTAFVERVDPALAALERPLLLTDWPLPLAALARQRADGAPVVERFEAYIAGVELANAFGELTDPRIQAARFSEELDARRTRGKAVYPADQRLLAALEEGLPPCAGVALGFDRLVMLATGARHIREVVAFTQDEL